MLDKIEKIGKKIEHYNKEIDDIRKDRQMDFDVKISKCNELFVKIVELEKENNDILRKTSLFKIEE